MAISQKTIERDGTQNGGHAMALSRCSLSSQASQKGQGGSCCTVFIRERGNYFKQLHSSFKSLLYRSTVHLQSPASSKKSRYFKNIWWQNLNSIYWHESTYNYFSHVIWMFRNIKVCDDSCLSLKYYVICHTHICIFLNFPKIEKKKKFEFTNISSPEDSRYRIQDLYFRAGYVAKSKSQTIYRRHPAYVGSEQERTQK